MKNALTNVYNKPCDSETLSEYRDACYRVDQELHTLIHDLDRKESASYRADLAFIDSCEIENEYGETVFDPRLA